MSCCPPNVRRVGGVSSRRLWQAGGRVLVGGHRSCLPGKGSNFIHPVVASSSSAVFSFGVFKGGGRVVFFGCMCKSGWARSNRPFFVLTGILVAVVWALSPQLSFMLSPPCWFLIVRWRRVCGGQLVSGECWRRLAPMCVLSEALNVASQWCGVGPVSERWVQSMPLASLC